LVDVENEIKKYTDSYIDAPFYTNHDMGRSAGYYNGDNAEEKTKMAQAMNLLMPGNAFLYYGVEIGMRGTANDETKRLAMRWSGDSKAKGMCVGPQNADSLVNIHTLSFDRSFSKVFVPRAISGKAFLIDIVCFTKLKGMCVGPQNAEETEQTYDTLDKQMEDPYSIYNFVKQTIKYKHCFLTIVLSCKYTYIII